VASLRSALHTLILLPLVVTPLFADDMPRPPSVHRQFMLMYRDTAPVAASAAPAGYAIRPIDHSARNTGLKKEVFGYLPYWFASRWAQIDMRLVSTIAYFSGEIAADGSIGSTHGWPKVPGDPSATAYVVNTINAAHAAGVKIVLCFTNFTGSEIDAIVSNPTYRNTFIQQSLAIVKAGNGDGININFEGINSSSKAALTQFMNALADSFHTNIPGSQVSCAPTDFDTRSGDWDLAALSAKVDLFFFQGYGYGWSASPKATPVGLLPNTSFWGSINSTTLINFALARIPASKVVHGVPHFGYRWPTTTGDVKSPTGGTGVAIYYPDALVYAANYGRQWEVNALNPWYRYQANGQWYQGWYDDPESMSYKYQFVLDKDLKGVGMWSLGMDGNNKDIWNMLAAYLTDSGYVPRTPSAPVLAAVKDTSRPSDPRILVRWRSSGTPTAAGFRLYLSQNPEVWPATPYLDESVLGPSAREKEIGGVNADVTYYVRMVAVDTLRVRISDSSDTYAVRVGNGAPFLVVDGFDRTTGSFASAHHDFGAQYGDALAANGAHFDCVDNDAVQAETVQLASYKGVFWFLGDESTTDQSLNTIEQGVIQTYLQNGGRLFITGSELGYDLGRSASPDYSPAFYANYMKAAYQGDNASTSTYTGAAGSAFEGIGGTFGSVYPEDYPDYIAPNGGSVAALTYSASQTAAVQYEGVFGAGTAIGKLVNVGFAVETIGSAAVRAALIGRVITFFGGASGVAADDPHPISWSIVQNFPNPFNPSTRIVVHVAERRLTTVIVFDVLGRRIATLMNEVKDPGAYVLTFDGSHFASGVYYCRITSGEFVGTIRMVLAK
jgi:hypothetical protein